MKDINSIRHFTPGAFEETRFEKIHNTVFEDSAKGSLAVAHEIAKLIKTKQELNENFVLGLATGSSPIKVYDELIRMHQEEDLSFKNVITFNLDEYYLMEKSNTESYHYFMHENLFNHIDIDLKNVSIPNGMVSSDQLQQYCLDYDAKIRAVGGLDFQLLGIGRTGHIGFNEPGSHSNSGTRSITLDHITRVDAASSFLGIDNVPRRAITMGIGTIKKAERIVLLAWGENKASVVKETIEGNVTSEVPASYLQTHPNTTIVLDVAASAKLARIRTPWQVSSCLWTAELKSSALVWLCEKTGKSILKLTDKDYNDNGMSGLLAEEGPAYDLNIKMFNKLQRTITGWPGGKANSDDDNRPERALPVKKRVLIFSPHPDDDVISMGGTLDRLVEQGHEVHVAYQTSGNIAVSDEEALKYAEVAQAISAEIPNEIKTIVRALKGDKISKKDELLILKIKTHIRRKESLGACRFLGLMDENVHFLDLPFYETGHIKKNNLGTEDIEIISDLIQSIQPHQIFAAGDLADPHGTHKVCLDAILMSIENLKKEVFFKDCWVWLYRGAWHDWEPQEIDMAVPMSEDQVLKKRKAIYYHQSQKDNVMFRGDDSREFWLRIEDRNRATAKKYNLLGMAEYEAMECFKRMIL